MQREITFENLPQAVSELIQKVDSLIQAIDMQNGMRTQGETEEPMIGIEEACKILGRAKTTIYALAQARKIPYYRPGKMLQFKRSELMQWMESAKRDNTVPTTEQIAEDIRKNIRHHPKSNWER